MLKSESQIRIYVTAREAAPAHASSIVTFLGGGLYRPLSLTPARRPLFYVSVQADRIWPVHLVHLPFIIIYHYITA